MTMSIRQPLKVDDKNIQEKIRTEFILILKEFIRPI